MKYVYVDIHSAESAFSAGSAFSDLSALLNPPSMEVRTVLIRAATDDKFAVCGFASDMAVVAIRKFATKGDREVIDALKMRVIREDDDDLTISHAARTLKDLVTAKDIDLIPKLKEKYAKKLARKAYATPNIIQVLLILDNNIDDIDEASFPVYSRAAVELLNEASNPEQKSSAKKVLQHLAAQADRMALFWIATAQELHVYKETSSEQQSPYWSKLT